MAVIKLNIGAAITRIPGFVNIDISSVAELSLDLNKDPLPFENDSVDLVFSYHTLEHVEHYIFALGEIHRVLRHGGRFLLGVPYVTSTELNLVNPYHKQHFSERSFDFFDATRAKGGAGEENAVLFRKVFHRFHHCGMFHILPPPLKTWSRRHLFNVVKKIDFGLVAIKDRSMPIEVSRDLVRSMQTEFQECMDARVPYNQDSRNFRRTSSTTLKNRLRRLKMWWNGTDE